MTETSMVFSPASAEEAGMKELRKDGSGQLSFLSLVPGDGSDSRMFKGIPDGQIAPLTGVRAGIHDMQNAFMVSHASFSPRGFPICHTTAESPPKSLITWSDAQKLHRRMSSTHHGDYHDDAFIVFYQDDQYFDGKRSGIWECPSNALKIIRHFGGIIAPDFSTNNDFPDPIKRYNFYRMNAFGCWIASLGIPVIANARWGTEETWEYCWDYLVEGDMIAIGSVASGLRKKANRPLFITGLFELVRQVNPKTILLYGTSDLDCIRKLRKMGINVIAYPSQTNIRFSKEATCIE